MNEGVKWCDQLLQQWQSTSLVITCPLKEQTSLGSTGPLSHTSFGEEYSCKHPVEKGHNSDSD